MGAKIGIVGLPNAGKSTLFNALTRAHALVAPYPFTTTDRNLGVATVEDARLGHLAGLIPHDRVIPTALEIVDIAGLVKGAHEGQGLGNQFLSHILGVDVLLHVVRCFDQADVPHVLGQADPVQDVEVVKTELLLKDLELIERRIDKEQKLAKGGDKHAQAFVEAAARWQEALGRGLPIRRLGLSADAHPAAFGVALLTSKPVIYAANIDEAELGTPPASLERLNAVARQEGAELIALCAKLEAELVELEPQDRAAMQRELGLVESALPQVVRCGYSLLSLITFFTTASRILQAWTVARGTKAPQAAGTIHSDFERQFIRAEVISVETLVACGGEPAAKAQGLLRTEGKDYVVQDGDVIHFRIGTTS